MSETVEVTCPEDLSASADLIRRKCLEAAKAVGAPAGSSIKILLPVAAAASAGIGLATLKADPPASR